LEQQDQTVIRYFAVPFEIGSAGVLVRARARQAPDASTAILWAKAMAAMLVGAMAYTRATDVDTGSSYGGEMIAAYGTYDKGPLLA
jgi:hypothetical protein